MQNYNEDISLLIRHQMTGEIFESEQIRLDSWLNESDNNRNLFEKIKKDIRISKEGSLFNQLDDESAWQKFKIVAQQRKKNAKRIVLHRIFKYASMIAVPFVIALTLLFWPKNQDRLDGYVQKEVVHAGVSKATLFSDDGNVYELGEEGERMIHVGEGIIAKQDHGGLVYDSSITASFTFNTLKIPRGGEFRLALSDGTKVYLNSATELKYPVTFNEKERTVYLSGEAYFEVSEDEKRPFYVITDKAQVRVYGTAFNMNAYQGKVVQTVLIQGKVSLKDKQKGEEVFMKPGELACLNPINGKITLEEVDAHQHVAWKNGYFAFENEILEQIMNRLSLWYDVDVVFNIPSTKKLKFTGYMRKYEQIDEILTAITDVTGVKFAIEGQRIVVIE